MPTVELSIAVTAHSETVVAGPAMRSVEIAIGAAQAEGFQIERLIGLDTPSDDCRAFFSQPEYASWRLTEHNLRDQGRGRNALAEIATGRWIAFVDADDLVSENWFVIAASLLAKADQENRKIIVHPEINWVFDARQSVFTKPFQDDPFFIPHYFYVLNYYDALCIAPREAFKKIPYVFRKMSDGFAYEDWQWNIESMTAGWSHVVAKNTIIFKRRRDISQTIESGTRNAVIRAIEPLEIDRIGELGRAPGSDRG